MAYKCFWCLFFVMLVFLASEERVVHVDGRKLCDSQSHRFKGTCLRHSNCANVCRSEGFPGGHCKGFRRRCFCEKPC